MNGRRRVIRRDAIIKLPWWFNLRNKIRALFDMKPIMPEFKISEKVYHAQTKKLRVNWSPEE